MVKVNNIKVILERLYEKYNQAQLIAPDPLQFVYRYKSAGDMEAAGLFAAVLAYGRVQQIEKDVTDLLGRMGDSPREFLLGFGKRDRAKLADFKHRFNTGQDLADLCEVLREVLKDYGTIEKYFASGFNDTSKDITNGLENFCVGLLARSAKHNGGAVRKGFAYLVPRPSSGSACKRLNLYLRWMIRNDDVDAGLWKSVGAAKLIVPVDVHMERLCRIIGFHERKTVSWRAAQDITQAFGQICPDDPVKYDFALSRIGIVEDCNGTMRQTCESCQLFGTCLQRPGFGQVKKRKTG